MGTDEPAKPSLFRFKRFVVDQTECAMKINTDGVLLGAMAMDDTPGAPAILDIGTGTGVIGLMLAQRFPAASVDAIEIDAQAAERAVLNFRASPFADRLTAFHVPLIDYAPVPAEEKYDLIVSNPPFFLDALKNPDPRKQLARHTDREFFSQLLHCSRRWLRRNGSLQLILPTDLAREIEEQARNHGFSHAWRVEIYSFPQDTRPIRVLLALHKNENDRPPTSSRRFVIYAAQDVYSPDYKRLLSDFFLAF